MNELNSHQIPFSSVFSSVFGSFNELLACSNESSGSHGLQLSPWPLVYSQKTHYDEATQYLMEDGCASIAGMQAVPEVSDFQGNLRIETGNACMDEFVGSSFQTNLLDVNMLDSYLYQALTRPTEAELHCGQYENADNEGQTTCSVRDLEQTTGVPLLENCLIAQNNTSRTQEVNGNRLHVIQSHLEPSEAASGFDSKGSRKRSREEINSLHCVGDLEQTTGVPLLENCLIAQNNTSRIQEVNGNRLHVIQSHPEPSEAASCFDTKGSRKRSLHCQRRCRIAKGIQDLEKFFPQPARNQMEVIDNSIQYVKHLQLQLEELSQNRLGGETDTDPLISMKGFDLQEIFGRLLEENQAAAMELLESRGLLMLPMTLVNGLCQTD